MTYGARETNQMGESFSNNSGKIEKRRISLEEFFFFFFRKTLGQKPQTNLLLLLFSLKIAARAFFPLLGSGMISSSSVQKTQQHNNDSISKWKKIAATLITLLHPNISLHILPTFIDISYGTDEENS